MVEGLLLMLARADEKREKEEPLTSLNTPPRPISSFKSAARLSPLLSSSMREGQSSLPEHTRTCSRYDVMTPLKGLSRSISSPAGRGGDAAQEQVAAGQLGRVGKLGAGVLRLEKPQDLRTRPKGARESLATGARDMKDSARRASELLRLVGVRKRRERAAPCWRRRLLGYRSRNSDDVFHARRLRGSLPGTPSTAGPRPFGNGMTTHGPCLL